MTFLRPAIFLAAALALSAQPAATLLIKNARVWTGDPKAPWADSVACTGDIITQVGNAANAKLTEGAIVIDAKGRLVTPGFIDAHVNVLESGIRMRSVQLGGVKSRQEFADRVAKFVAARPAGEWIVGGGWEPSSWGGELPTREWIDKVTPNHPVWLASADGQMSLANGVTLSKAKLTRETPAVNGGKIVRDAKGEPTGVLMGNAMEVVDKIKAPAGDTEAYASMVAAMKELNRHGVTSVHNMGSMADMDLFNQARENGTLTVRVYSAHPVLKWQNIGSISLDTFGDRWVRWGLMRGELDGTLISRTAAFEQPYADAPGEQGYFATSPHDIHNRAYVADWRGAFIAIRATGDRGVRTAIGIYEKMLQVSNIKDHRFRIESAQHIRPEDIPRMAKIRAIASMQPYKLIDEGRWAESRVGPERAKNSWAFRSLLDAGVVLAFGSDWSYAPPSPLMGIYAAVTRRTLDGKHPNGWIPAQKITAEEALRAYTYGGAWAAVDEVAKGTVSVNKVADLAMIDQDITKVAPEKIREASVVLTVVGGKPVYQK